MAKVALSIDYEFDWGGRVKSSVAIETMTDIVLDILDKNDAKATFFISGETVDKTKDKILKIYQRGHEIASHGFNHNVQYDKLSYTRLDLEMQISKKVLEDTIQDKVYGFRTPQFRKNRHTEELLLKNGYMYDSSSVEVNFLDRYEKNQFQYGQIKNFPVSSIYGKIPAGLKWINLLGNHIKSSNGIVVIYLHFFDLLPIKKILQLYDKKVIKKTVLLFYLARIGSLENSLRKVSKDSKTLKSYIKEDL